MFKTMIKPAIAAGIALAAISAPANAQVNGIAVSEASVTIASSEALQAGYQQIGTTYAAQITALDQYNQQRTQLVQTLDTNGDGQIDDTEAAVTNDASNPTVQQLQTLEQQIAETQAPIQLARLYVVNQVGQQYTAAVQQVISDRGIQIMLSPEAIVYAPEEADVTQSVVEALNARLPSVSVTPPAGWQPNQATINLYQQVQQVFAIARAQQQQAATAGEAAAPATEGR